MADKIGDAFIEVHADTLPFDRELDNQLGEASKRAEKGLDRTGKQFGDKVSDSMARRIGQRGKDFGRAVENATRNVTVRVRNIVRFDRIRDSVRKWFRRDVGDGISEEVGQALDRAARPGGPLSKFGGAIADAVGAGFNISGRSPLIAVLLPALAALLGLILALVQAVNALVAVLFIVPGLIASIGLQVGVVAIAFQGMGKAIQGAFAAKNTKELREALKGLTPSARNFVKELLPLRNLFREIGQVVQENFFKKLTGVITAIRRSLGPSLIKGFGQLASAMGQFFEDFGLLLASPGFKNFFNKLIPATSRWLDKFGMSLFGDRGLVTALLSMATMLMPFMERFGDIVLRNLDHLAGLMFQFVSNPATQQWLDNMAATLQLVFDLLFKVGEFLFIFMAQLDKAGGAVIIETLLAALQELILFLASPVGLKAMEGMVNLGIIGIKVFVGLLIAVLAVVAALEALGEWFRVTAGPFILDILRALGQAAVDMSTFLGVWIQRIINAVVSFFVWLWNQITTTKNNFGKLTKAVADSATGIFNKLKAIPGQVAGIFKNFGSLLVNAGRALIQGLIDGIRAKVGPLLDLIHWIAGKIAAVFPGSPAKEGPLSGHGYVLLRGQRMMQDFVKGIEMEVPALKNSVLNATSNIVFGRDSVQVNFQGAQPTDTQARSVGNAVGQGAAGFLAARNTRLAVRTL